MATAEQPGNATQELGDDVVDDDKPEYLSGLRLWLVLASVTLVAFVMLLDMSIIVTVILFRPPCYFSQCSVLLTIACLHPGNTSNHQ